MVRPSWARKVESCVVRIERTPRTQGSALAVAISESSSWPATPSVIGVGPCNGDGEELGDRAGEPRGEQRIGESRLGHFVGAAAQLKPTNGLPGVPHRENPNDQPRRDHQPSPADEGSAKRVEHGTMVGPATRRR